MGGAGREVWFTLRVNSVLPAALALGKVWGFPLETGSLGDEGACSPVSDRDQAAVSDVSVAFGSSGWVQRSSGQHPILLPRFVCAALALLFSFAGMITSGSLRRGLLRPPHPHRPCQQCCTPPAPHRSMLQP